jgi:hypothetical protein
MLGGGCCLGSAWLPHAYVGRLKHGVSDGDDNKQIDSVAAALALSHRAVSKA